MCYYCIIVIVYVYVATIVWWNKNFQREHEDKAEKLAAFGCQTEAANLPSFPYIAPGNYLPLLQGEGVHPLKLLDTHNTVPHWKC